MCDEPLFSVVIPTYCRPAQLTRCLQGLAALDFPVGGVEVIVVYDGSGCAENTPPSELEVLILEQPRAGPASARNTGARAARGTYLAFIDDDCLPDPGWLRAFERRLAHEPDAAIAGHTENALHDNIYAEATQLLIDYLYAAQTGTRDAFFTSNNLVFPAAGFREIGGFDATFPLPGGEDRDLCARWLAEGRPLALEPSAVVRHEHDLTLCTYVRQHFNYGRGAFGHHARRRVTAPQHRSTSSRDFYVSLLRYPYRQRRPRQAELSALLVVSQAATAAGYAWERLRRR